MKYVILFIFRVIYWYKWSFILIRNPNFISNKKPKYKCLSHFINFKALFLFPSSCKNKYFVVFCKKKNAEIILILQWLIWFYNLEGKAGYVRSLQNWDCISLMWRHNSLVSYKCGKNFLFPIFFFWMLRKCYRNDKKSNNSKTRERQTPPNNTL